jgi:hypothetical protein
MAKLKASNSKYSKKQSSQAQEDFEDDFSEEDSFENEDMGEDFSQEEDFEEMPQEKMPKDGHLRSRGLFKNIWWKKGLLKGFSVWIAIVIIFYIFDFLKLVDVISWERWFFFLIILLIFGIAYEKFLYGKISF